jgi:protein-L-isoaspartate(D-aspartate) O-methyltransferase
MPSLKKWTADELERARRIMVEMQIAARDVKHPKVLDAMLRVPRHLFVPFDLIGEAYDDTPLPIGFGQTISQPYIVGSMTEYLLPTNAREVLEIGTGSGYQTAILAELFEHVDTVEIIPELSRQAEKVLGTLGYTNITCHVGDGLDLPETPVEFQAVIVTAAPAELPPRLLQRLAPEGRLIIPIGGAVQYLQLIAKDRSGIATTETLYPVRFVSLQRKRR